MKPERWSQIQKIFDAALEMGSRDRPGYLRQACGDDAELQLEVESLLSAHEESETFLEQPSNSRS